MLCKPEHAYTLITFMDFQFRETKWSKSCQIFTEIRTDGRTNERLAGWLAVCLSVRPSVHRWTVRRRCRRWQSRFLIGPFNVVMEHFNGGECLNKAYIWCGVWSLVFCTEQNSIDSIVFIFLCMGGRVNWTCMQSCMYVCIYLSIYHLSMDGWMNEWMPT